MRLIVVNYASNQSQGRVFPILPKSFQKLEDLKLKDFLTKEEYTRNVEMISNHGLYIDLQSYQSHLFIVQ